MLTLAILLGYFAVGLVLARSVFVNTLGDAERIQPKSDYSSLTFWTTEFTSAVWWSMGTVFAWPLIAPIRIVIFADTPYEADIKKAKQQRALEARFEELEREVLQFGKNL